MPRLPSERVEEGFQIWATDAGRNDTKTAELMGLAQETVSYWHRTYGWDARFLALIAPDAEEAVQLTRAALRTMLPATVNRLAHIITARTPVTNAQGEIIGETWAASDRDAIQALKLFYQYAFEGVPERGLRPPVLDPSPLRPALRDDKELSLGQLQKHTSELLEAEYHSVNTRIRRGPRV
jgi:hypothetical protein